MPAITLITKRCPACAESHTHTASEPRIRSEDPAFSECSVVACDACGLKSAYPMPTLGDLERAYRHTRHQVNIEPTSVTGRMWRRFRDSGRVRLLSRFVPTGTIVDVGTGAGLFLKAADARGNWNMVGTDLSRANVDALRSDFDVRLGTLEDVGLKEGSIDAIWASHVIEHMIDPFGFLVTAARYLKEGGHIFIFVPSETSLRAVTHTSHWHYVNPPGHLWGFRPSTLRPIIERSGFEIEECRNSLIINEMICVARSRG